jgi:hypothetical protein
MGQEALEVEKPLEIFIFGLSNSNARQWGEGDRHF